MNIGIIGLGHIAEKMADTINRLEGFNLYAVASRSMEKAEAFKERFHAVKAYGSYLELMQDLSVDLVYIATPHSFHREQMMLCLAHNKPVLCEKIFTTKSLDTIEIYKRFEEKGLYVSEALWTSFMPSVEIIRNLIKDNVIGPLYKMEAYFEYSVMHKKRIIKKELGGGAAMDLGVYPISFILRTLGFNYDEVKILSKENHGEVDAREILEFCYGDITATCYIDGLVTGSQEVILYGDNGKILINSVNNPSLIRVMDKNGNMFNEIHCESEYGGFEYELKSAKKAIEEHKTESLEWTHKNSICLAEIIDDIIY